MQDPERLPRETARAYSACLEYLHLGIRRTQAEVARKTKTDQSAVCNWCRKYDWEKRAAAHDAAIRVQENELADIQRRAAFEARMRWEQERRQIAQDLARDAARVCREIFQPGIRYSKINKSGELETKGTFPIMHGAILLREFNRLSLAASHDVIYEERLKERDSAASGALAAAVTKIGGSFSVGDKMFDGSAPPPLPVEMPKPEPEPKPLVDLTGTEGLYPTQEKEV